MHSDDRKEKDSLFQAASQNDVKGMKRILDKHPEWLNMPVDKYRVKALCKHATSERIKYFILAFPHSPK